MKGYRDAEEVLRDIGSNPLPSDMQKQLQLQFEKLVILDYIIRNTGKLYATEQPGFYPHCTELPAIGLFLNSYDIIYAKQFLIGTKY